MAEGTVAGRLRGALRGLVRPPDLTTDEERTASRLELFFDLAFVLVIAELAIALREEVTLHGELQFAALFTLVWWSWVSSTLYANRFDHDDVLHRLYKLGSMAAVIGLAASATEATGSASASSSAASCCCGRCCYCSTAAPTGTSLLPARSPGSISWAPASGHCCGRSPCWSRDRSLSGCGPWRSWWRRSCRWWPPRPRPTSRCTSSTFPSGSPCS